MKKLTGKAVYEGIALGKLHILQKQEYSIKKEIRDDAKAELVRVEIARKKAKEELQKLYDKVYMEAGESSGAIIRVQQMMLEDENYLKAVEEIIENRHVNAEYAVFAAGEEFAQTFAAMDDEYIKERAADVKDVTDRLIKCLCNGIDRITEFEEPVILAADDLSPSETVVLDKRKILAFVTVHGSANSHTAILARTMNIPALVGVEMDLAQLRSGTEVLADGFTGEFIIEPDDDQKEDARRRLEEYKNKQMSLRALIGKEAVTRSGKKVALFANVGNLEDIKAAMENDAGGIGLFRSEFFYIGRDTAANEEEQFAIYKKAVEAVNGKKLIVRTLDIGADKQADFLDAEKEENPALGYRGIRICLSNRELFKTQLRALYRASVYGNLSIMYPMIISTEEVEAVKNITAEVKAELAEEKIPYKDVEEGIMIETPAAVMISDELAQMVDFFSIGTNDLTQYTLAIDRQNEKLDMFYNPHHKAVMRMIQLVIENAHKAGKRVAVCGELAADTELLEWFINVGIDELSVAPASILKLRHAIRQMR